MLPGCNFWKACIRREGSLRNEKKVVPRYYPWAAAAVVYPELLYSRTDRGDTETSQVDGQGSNLLCVFLIFLVAVV